MKNHLVSLAIVSMVLATSAFADNYKIIIDAGSTGSRLHLFQYQAEEKGVPVIKDIFSENVKPGLSSYKDKPKEAGNGLKILLNHVAEQLHNKQINPHDIEVNVLATAGMRLLDPAVQKQIYDNVKETVAADFKVGRVETIPGKEEALYGWLDINYLAKNFQNHTPTMGSIDMGGASTQIAFVTQETNKADDILSVTLDGVKYNVFGKSFLGLGQDQARDKINLQKEAGSCYPTGYSSSVIGEFNFATCGSLFADLIEKNHVSEQILPLGKQTFYAFSGAYYTYKFLEADQTPDQADVEKRILSICSKSWDQLTRDYPTEKYLSTYCANAIYMGKLFYNTYQIGNAQLSVVGKVNGQDIDWTMGAMLYSLVQ